MRNCGQLLNGSTFCKMKNCGEFRVVEKSTADPNNIREMNLETDLDQVKKIWLQGIKETAPPLTSGAPWDSKLDGFIEQIKITNERYVYEENGIIKGFITAGIPTNKNYLSNLYVDSNARGKGIGTKLLDKLRKTYRYLDSHVYERNPYLKFYQNHGFEVSGEQTCPDTGEIKLRIRW